MQKLGGNTHSKSVEIKWNFPFSGSFSKWLNPLWPLENLPSPTINTAWCIIGLPASYACTHALFLEKFSTVYYSGGSTDHLSWPISWGKSSVLRTDKNDFVFHRAYTNWILKWFNFHICCSRLPYQADRSVVMWAARLFSFEEDSMKREKVTHKSPCLTSDVMPKHFTEAPDIQLRGGDVGGFSFWKLPGKLGPIQKVHGVSSIYEGMIYCPSAPPLSEGLEEKW